MKKQAKKFIEELECNGKFADADLIKELLNKIAELEKELKKMKFGFGIAANEIKRLSKQMMEF